MLDSKEIGLQFEHSNLEIFLYIHWNNFSGFQN